jgi:hypothetical protein
MASVQAGVVELDFNTDPLASGVITSLNSSDPVVWRQDGGASGANGDGYLAVTDSRGSQSSHIVFADLEPGFLIASFVFECDLRMGGGLDAPADGFSVNFASAEDPIVVAADQGLNPNGPYAGTDGEASLPEEGTQTGLAVGFDTWQSATINGVQDVVGISVRVNGELLTQFPVPLKPGNQYPGGEYDPVPYRNLPKGDPNYNSSMQTGSRNSEQAFIDAGYNGPNDAQPDWGDPNWGLWVANLNWERFRMEVTPAGRVKIFWKGVELTPEGGLATTFTPIPGRIVFGARTGANWQVHHVDNIRIETVPANVGLVGGVDGEVLGFVASISDSGNSVVDPDSIELTLDGAPVQPTSITKDGIITRVRYVGTQPQVAGSTHTVVVTGKDMDGNTLVASGEPRTYTVPQYTALPAEFAVTGVNTSARGFEVRGWQTDGVGTGTTISGAERMLHGDFGDNFIDTQLYVNGVYTETGTINYEQEGLEAGAFTAVAEGAFNEADKLFPGIPGLTSDPSTTGFDNFAFEFITYLHLDVAGVYTFIFNSDDGFRITSAPNPREQLNSVILNQADNGKGASDISSLVYVAEPGYYPVRIIYYEGDGGASAEFSIIKPNGQRLLVNSDAAGAVRAYRTRTGDTPSAVTYTSRVRGSGPIVQPLDPLRVEITDGASPVQQGSVEILINGTPRQATISKNGNVTTALVTPTLSNLWPSGQTLDVEVRFTEANGNQYSGHLEFPTATYTPIPPQLATAVGTGAEPGMKWRTYQTAAGHGTTTPGAENALAGGNGPSIHDTTGQGPDGFFNIAYVNFDQTEAPSGNFSLSATIPELLVPDLLIPGIPGTTGSTDNIAAEALTYLELQPGLYTMVVNSDDGFEVTTGIKSDNVADMKFLSLGGYNGGRGSADTTFNFTVEQAGVYFFRLLWYEGGGGANVEWFTVNPDGSRALVGGEQTGSIRAFRTRTVAEPSLPDIPSDVELTISADGQNITIAWEGGGTLQESTDLETWTNVAGATSPHTVTANQTARFYRVEK